MSSCTLSHIAVHLAYGMNMLFVFEQERQWPDCFNMQISKLSIHVKGKEHTFRGDNSVKIVLLLFRKGVYSNRKEFAPFRCKCFPFRVDPFSEGDWYVGKQINHKSCRNSRTSTKCIQVPLRYLLP